MVNTVIVSVKLFPGEARQEFGGRHIRSPQAPSRARLSEPLTLVPLKHKEKGRESTAQAARVGIAGVRRCGLAVSTIHGLLGFPPPFYRTIFCDILSI